jgi:hypothetical protein
MNNIDEKIYAMTLVFLLGAGSFVCAKLGVVPETIKDILLGTVPPISGMVGYAIGKAKREEREEREEREG